MYEYKLLNDECSLDPFLCAGFLVNGKNPKFWALLLNTLSKDSSLSCPLLSSAHSNHAFANTTPLKPHFSQSSV